MTIRNWSPQTMAWTVVGGIVVTLAIGNFIFMEYDPLLGPVLGPYLKPATYGKPENKKQEEPTTSTK